MRYIIPDIFAFNDYRAFLKELFAVNKEADPQKITHETICRDLGQSGRTFFNNVVVGRRDLTDTFINRFIDILGLEGNERDYFRNLVKFNQAQEVDEKQYYYKQIIMFGSTPRQIIEKKKYSFYSEWYHASIRSLLDIVNVKDDYAFLAQKIYPPITVKQAQESIQLLLELELISLNDEGYYKPTHTVLSSGPDMKDFLLKKYQLQCLENLHKIIFKRDIDCQNYSGTFSISEKGLEQILDRIDQFKAELRTIISKDEDDPSMLYYINLNLFPQTR
jgi:uncharacterized protein (TIGR02147 family)